MKRFGIAAVLLLGLLTVSVYAFSQSSFATVTGTISDSTGALIPGVAITATNNSTGIVSTTLSNETGTYNLPGLLPGVYRVKAELSGFQIETYTDVQLGNNAQVRLNFTLKVANVAQSVEVSIPFDTLLAASSSSVGEVLSQQKVADLPLLSNNVLDLILVMNGVEGITTSAFGQESTTFGGVSAREINIQRDGISVNEGRFPTGVRSATRLSPDLVGEIRMILAPVDAEMGRGNGQIQVQTRSGGNQFRGSAVWYVKNSALNANTWANNRNQPNPITPNWSNRHQYTLSYGGPIIKNKTFFYAVWDGFISANKTSMTSTVLTPCARNGIFRYYDNWNNGNINQITTTTPSSTTPTIAVVDALGNPKAPTINPDGTAGYTGNLRYSSVFGPVLNTPSKADCSDAILGTAATSTGTWDTYRTKVDPTGSVAKQLKYMPPPNQFDGGDGLNTASFRWRRTFHGTDNIYGLDESTGRKQINIKVDHNFNNKHKANVSWSYERNDAPDYFMIWPDTVEGETWRRPSVWTANFTSTLSPTLLNEARFGYRVTGTNTLSPFDTPAFKDAARAFVPTSNGMRVVPQLGTGAVNFQLTQYIGNRGAFPNTNQDVSPLWQYADTVSWTKGKHSYKSGVEIRLARSNSIADGFFGGAGSAQTYARATGGELSTSQIVGITSANIPGLAGTTTTGNNVRMRNLLTFLAGSIGSVNHRYYIVTPNADHWDDFRANPYIAHDWHQNEWSLFFKDDWKVRKNLTLNLGVRYEYYGVPFINQGTTIGLVGGGGSLFGISGRDFNGWMKPLPGASYDANLITQLQFVGPNSPHSNIPLYSDDRNNIGPAVGFAWQVPWFGENRTTLRGGYQVTYQGGGRFYDLDTQGVANPPGSGYIANYIGLNAATGVQKQYLDMTDALAIVPIPPVVTKPLQTVPITDRSQVLVAFDKNYVSPYTQNFTLQLTRSLRRNLIVDIRYVGTMQLHGYRDLNLNTADFLYNGLKEAFDAVRSGSESPLLDQMFKGINIAGTGFGPVGTPLNGVAQTAGLQMRASTTFNTNLANGNYVALANTLNTLVINQATNPGIPGAVAGANGAVLRYNGFPENFIATNPQFSTATLKTNLGHTNYHSLQIQTTLRQTHGFTYQGTYSWSKNLGYGQAGTGAQGVSGSAPSFTNPVDRRADYVLQAGDRRHEFRMNGTFELPVGPSKLLFPNSSGWIARAIERWQMGFIINLTSGSPVSITANNMLYANGVPDIVGPFPSKFGSSEWNVVSATTGQITGTYFPSGAFVSVKDPQCSRIAANLQSLCTLQALADGKTNQILLQNPLPGTRGTLGQFTMEDLGTWRFDANLSKSFRISESKSFQLRVDTMNALNHPSPGTPSLTINPTGTTVFGSIASKSGSRTFQGQMRLTF